MTEQNQYDQKQAILIAVVTGVGVFAVLTVGLMVVMAVFRLSQEDPVVAKSPSAKLQSPASFGVTVSTPEPTIPKPPRTAPKETPPSEPRHRRPKPSPPDLPPPVYTPPIAPPSSPSDEKEIPSSSFLDGEIMPLDPKFLEPTAEELRAKKAEEEAKEAAIAFITEFAEDPEEQKRLVEEMLVVYGEEEASSWRGASRLVKLRWLKRKGKLTDEAEAALREEWGLPSLLPTRHPTPPAHHPKPPPRHPKPAHRGPRE